MKIVHISFADFNGAGLCAYRICKAQRAMGLQSEMVVLRKKQKDSFVHAYGGATYFVHSAKHKINKLLGRDDVYNTCRTLAREYNTVFTLPTSPIDLTKHKSIQAADIIHIHWVGGYLDYPSFFEAMKDKTIVFTLHDQNLLYGIANTHIDNISTLALEKGCFYTKKEAVLQAKRAGIVFLSKMIEKRYAQHPLAEHAQTTIIHNAIDTQQFKPKNQELARKRLGIDKDTIVFAFCAYNIWDKGKGLKVLMAALEQMDINYKLLIIGKNGGKPIGNNAIEVGRLATAEEMSWVLSAADYFCMPSFNENFAQAPMEAMACGLPVIAFPCSGTEELITPQNGVRCEDFTVEALQKGILKALRTEYDSYAIREDMKRRFSPRKITQAYLHFYHRVMQGKR